MKVDINQDMLTEEQAQWLKEIFVSFSDNLISSNIFTPSLLNQNLRNLNNNAQIPTYDNLTKALNNAVESGELLQAYQEWTEFAEITFKRLLEYYANILSFDLSYTCVNVKKKDEYKSARYQKDKRIVENFLTNFNYKEEFYKVVHQMMRTETAFYWFRNNEDINDPKDTLLLMPQN